MHDLKAILNKVILTKPDVLQFAKDRKYEESWVITSSESQPSENERDLYLTKDSFEILIAEFIWNSQDDNKRFVLTLFFDSKCLLKDNKSFVDIICDLFYNYSDFYSFIEVLNTKIIGNDYLLNTQVDSVNIGIFNHWLSVGPVDLWEHGDPYDIKLIKSKIQLRPEIEKTQLNYQGLLFRFNVNGKQNGPYYGIKTPCCTKVENKWIVDYQQIDKWMNLMLEL